MGSKTKSQECEYSPQRRQRGRSSLISLDLLDVGDVLRQLSDCNDSLESQRKCCRLVTQLTCNNSESKQTLIDAGAVQVVQKAMSKYPQDYQVQRFGCGALGNLLTRDSEAVVKANGIDLILSAMREFPQEEKVQFHAVRCLVTLTSDNDNKITASIRQRILDLGGVDVLQTAMKLYSGEGDGPQNDAIVKHANKTLNSLQGGVARGGTALAGSTMMDPHLAVLVDRLRLPLKANRTLEMLLDLELSKPEQEATRAEFDNTALISNLIHAMREGLNMSDDDDKPPPFSPVTMEINGCKLMVDLTFRHDDNKDALIAAGAAPVLVQAMTRWLYCEQLQLRACRALRNLLSGDDNKQTVVQAGGVEAVLTAMREYPEDAKLLEEACGAISNLTNLQQRSGSESELRQRMQAQNGVQLLKHAQSQFSGNTKIVKYTKRALSKLQQTQELSSSLHRGTDRQRSQSPKSASSRSRRASMS